MGENYLALTKRESSILTLLLRSIKMKKKQHSYLYLQAVF